MAYWHPKPGFPILGVFRLKGQPKRDDGIIIQVLQGQSIVWHDSRVQFSAYFPSLTHCSAVLEGVVRFYNGRGTAVMFVTMKPTRGRRDGQGHRRTVRLHHARRPAPVRIGAGPEPIKTPSVEGERTQTQPDTSRNRPAGAPLRPPVIDGIEELDFLESGLQCAFTPLAGDLKTTKMDKKHGSRQESHPLSDRPTIDWPCRT